MTVNNYRQSHFRIKEPAKIHGEPTFDKIKVLYDSLKTNATSAPSSKGGGRHGHLGIVIAPADCALISLTPFNRTADPGEFVIPDGAANIDAAQIAKVRYQSALDIFTKESTVDVALKQFISDSLEEIYLEPFINTTTRNIEYDIPFIIKSLFDDYGELNSSSLMQKQQILNTYVFDFKKPIVQLYNIAEDYHLYASMQGTRIDPSLIISTVQEIIRKTGKFHSHIDKWDEKLAAQKTWDNFKTHFQQAQKKVRMRAATTTEEVGYTNIISDITTGVANMISDTESTPEATNFLQTLSSSVVHNQGHLNQITDTLNDLQTQLAAINASRSNHQQPPPPPQFQPPRPPQQ